MGRAFEGGTYAAAGQRGGGTQRTGANKRERGGAGRGLQGLFIPGGGFVCVCGVAAVREVVWCGASLVHVLRLSSNSLLEYDTHQDHSPLRVM